MSAQKFRLSLSTTATLLVVGGLLSGCTTTTSSPSDADAGGGAFDVGEPAGQRRLIVPPANGGVYVGQYEFVDGEISTLEATLGDKLAIGSRRTVIDGMESIEPSFVASAATDAHSSGYAFFVGAIEPTPMVEGFTVDKLLQGDYDAVLHALAEGFKAHGEPMFFEPGREFNGVLGPYMAGFDVDGSKGIAWALDNEKGLDEFHPESYPNAELYVGLGRPDVCDGAERLAAAHRYYFDFFVRREGIPFLTFVSSGWAAQGGRVAPEEMGTHEGRLLTSCTDFRSAYPGNDFVDWVAINRHFFAEPGADGEGVTYSTSEVLGYVDDLMLEVREVASGKPVIVTEISFPDGVSTDSAIAAAKIREGLPALLAHPEIRALYFWGNAGDPSSASQDVLIRPGTQQAAALVEVLAAHGPAIPCVSYSDGTVHGSCQGGH